MSSRRFAITDIHGCAKTFQSLVEETLQLNPADQLFLLGDFIDRGPDSKGVIDFIIKLKKQHFQVICIRGNHEEMMLRGGLDPIAAAGWKRHGGIKTLESFNAASLEEVPDEYFQFMRKLPMYHLLDDYILVHAGINFNVDDPLSDSQSMMWMRPWDVRVNHDWLNGRVILHGHTPVDRNVIEYQVANAVDTGLIDLDNGCFRIEEPGKGSLCALDLDTRDLFFCSNLDL